MDFRQELADSYERIADIYEQMAAVSRQLDSTPDFSEAERTAISEVAVEVSEAAHWHRTHAGYLRGDS